MAGDTASLGKLVVDLLLKDDQFQAAMGKAQTDMRSGSGNLASMAKSAGGQITAAFKLATATIVAFGAASTAVGAKFEQQMAMVGALQGLQQTDKAFQDLEGQARMLGSTTEFTATQAAGALEELARAGATVEESIASSNSALVLAGTSASSLADSTQLLVSTQRQFGLEAAESERITNVFSQAMRNSLLDFTSVREAMKFAGTAGASFGMSLEETTASVAAFRDIGLEGSLAGTNFRMAMIQAAKGTDQQNAALKKYGITMADINPEQNTFIDIVEKMGEVGLTATDAVAVFGARAGTNMAQLAAETAKGNVNMREFTGTLMEASEEGNTAADMYQTIGQTVSYASKVAVSALQDLMIEVFGTFAGPLRELIETLPEVLNTVTDSVRKQGPQLRASFSATLGGISKFLRENAAGLADAFSNTMQVLADLGPVLEATAAVLIVMARNADILIGALAFGMVVVSALKMVAVVNALAVALGGAEVAVAALGVTMTVTTGGIFAAVIAVGAIVTALLAYITTVARARRNTDLLRDAQARLSGEAEEAAAKEEKRIGKVLSKQQEAARAELESGEELADGREAALNQILALDAAQARQAKVAGELLEVNDGLVNVQQLMNDLGEDGREFILASADASEADAKSKGKQIRQLEKLIDSTQEHEDGLKDMFARGVGEKINRDDIESMQDAIAVLGVLRQERADAEGQASALRNKVATERRGQIKQVTDAEFQALRDEANAQEAAGGEQVDTRRQALDEILALERKLAADVAKAQGDEQAQIDAALAERVAKIRATFAEALALAAGNAQELIELETRKDAALGHAREMAHDEAVALAKQKADELAAVQAEMGKRIARITKDVSGDVQRIEAEKQLALVELAEAGATKRQLAEVTAAFDRRAERARVAAERRGNAIILAARGKHLSRREQLQRANEQVLIDLVDASVDTQTEALQALWKEYKRGSREATLEAAKSVVQFGKDTVAAVGQAMGAMANLVSSVSGGFDLESGAQGVIDLQDEAAAAQLEQQTAIAEAQERLAEAQAGGDDEAATKAAEDLAAAQEALALTEARMADGATGFATEFVDGLIDQAVRLAEGLGEAAGPLLERVAEQIPILMDAIIAAIPDVVDALVANIPNILQGIIDKLPMLITALVRGATDIVVMVLDILPGLLTTILTEVLPTLITEVVAALPVLITAIVDAVPLIIIAVTEAIPVIIGAVIDALPTLIFALISAMPRVYAAIIGALPEIAFALVDGLWQHVFKNLPKNVARMWEALVDGAGTAFRDIANGIWEALTGFINLGKGGEGESEKNGIFKNVFGKGSQGAYSGMDYVPATMRMTLHKGEAVVPADRNAERLSGQTAPAAAGHAQNTPGGGGGGGQPIDIAIIAEGRLLDAVQVRAMKRGGAVQLQNEIRRSSGVRVGLDAGRFNQWSN